ncbi:MAG: TIGR03790 family protein, partial [Planctomycetes bacterium]|nr:TIGR03790 family protein [Planctomycetota bacterium]
MMAHPLAQGASTADPARLLVVYNANWTGDEDGDGVQDSLEVAQYYMAKRGIPAANILGVATNDSGYDASTYAAMHSELITPLKNKLAALGTTNIDIILMSYRMPIGFRGQSIDNLVMGLNYWSTTSDNISWTTNPYLEPTPTIGSDNGGFLHSSYQFNGTTMYLVCRLDGSFGVTGCLDLVDQALYGDRYVSSQAGYYGGNIYVDSDGRGGTSDATLAANPAVQSGNYSSYSDCDANIGYGEHYVAASGFPLKWTCGDGTIGAAGLTFQDGSDATSAPRALMYGGWYNYNNYKNVFEWLPGSVACDLNSSSLIDYWLRLPTTLAWGRRALCSGATCVCGVTGEPYTTGHTRPNVLLYYMLNGYSFAEAAAAANPAIGWMSYAIGDPLYAPTRAKTLVRDTQNPGFAAGSPTLVMNERNGCAVKI